MSLLAESTPDDPKLVRAFEENEFDIAGLADLSLDYGDVDAALCELFLILANGTEPRRSSRARLAKTLLAMVVVARQDYAGSGHQEYWPYLFDRIAEAATEVLKDLSFPNLRGPENQALLGKWFRLALDEFGYTIPEEGQKFVGPVIFHAGIPKSSLSGALQLIDTAVEHYGEQAVSLPHDLRARLAKNHSPALHRNTERLLTSQLKGASQLWSCLARVLLAWRRRSECTEELRCLPSSLDPEDVRRALPGKRSGDSPSRPRNALPQVHFDVQTGEVLLTAPSGTPGDWSVIANGRVLDVCWTRTYTGLAAEFTSPPPEEFCIALRGSDGEISRTVATNPDHWPGIWFHASNGNIEDAIVIDANGLEPGRWFAIFEGSPTRWNVPSVHRVHLKWSCFAGQAHWTAWEIDVPPRSHDRTSLECFVDDNRFHVALARRPGTRVELQSEPVATAWNAVGEAVAVFSEPPLVRLRRDRGIEGLLLKETADDVATLQRVELPPEQEWRVPVNEPGIYQLREGRGVGRILLHFAFIPGLKVSKLIYDATKSRVEIEINDANEIGAVFTTDHEPLERGNGVYRHRQSTVEPLLSLEWRWRETAVSALRFHWAVEGLRWRVLRSSDEHFRWTREPIFVSPVNVKSRDAQLEVQVPNDADLRINEVVYSDELRRGGQRNGIVLSLLPFGDLVEVGIDEEKLRPAVVLSDRPVLDRLEALSDGTSVVLSWDARANQQGTAIVAWDPLAPFAIETLIPLTDEQIQEGECFFDCEALPGEKWTSLAIARSVRVGFSRRVLHLASSPDDADRPLSLLLDRMTGRAHAPNPIAPEHLADLLHSLTLNRLDRRSVNIDEIVGALSHLGDHGRGDFTHILHLYETLGSDDSSVFAPGCEEWRHRFREAVTLFFCQQVRRHPSGIFASTADDRAAETLESLLRMGIPVGQSCPLQWLSHDSGLREYSCAYPFRFICDLWMLGSSAVDASQDPVMSQVGPFAGFAERRKDAAERVWRFLQSRELSIAFRLLPISQAVAAAPHTSCGHNHFFALPPRSISTAGEFADTLGIEDWALDCHANSGDPNWDDGFTQAKGTWHSPTARKNLNPQVQQRRRTPDYSLLWVPSEQTWYIERPARSSPTCCKLVSSPLLVTPLTSSKLLADFQLQQLLSSWAELDPKTPGRPASSTATFEPLIELLGADPVSGELHRQLLAAGSTETKALFGTVVSVTTQAALAERIRLAWLIAWIDRFCAWKGASRFFSEEPPTQGLHREFLTTMGVACGAWPRLMERCFALAEVLIWTLYRGGIGSAVRFGNPDVAQRPNSPAARTTTTKGAITYSFDDRNRSESEVVVTDAVGLIIACNGRTGRILVKHPKTPSLEVAVRSYLDSKPDSHRWQAEFDWRAIGTADLRRIDELCAARRPSVSGQASTIADVLCGMTVRCELRKKAKWEVSAMRIIFGAQRFIVPSCVR